MGNGNNKVAGSLISVVENQNLLLIFVTENSMIRLPGEYPGIAGPFNGRATGVIPLWDLPRGFFMK